jgi:hypothetical protein
MENGSWIFPYTCTCKDNDASEKEINEGDFFTRNCDLVTPGLMVVCTAMSLVN